MKRLFGSALLVLAATMVSPTDLAADYAPREAVTVLMCKSPEPIAEHIPVHPRALATHDDCHMFSLPVQLRNISIFAGPLKDFEGDDFYIGEYKGLYFPVWPGSNAPAL